MKLLLYFALIVGLGLSSCSSHKVYKPKRRKTPKIGKRLPCPVKDC